MYQCCNQINWYDSIVSTVCFLFCWSVVVFTSTWHLYFRVTYSDTAAPGYHRFILKVRRMKHMNSGVPGGPTLTMGHFRLERLLTGLSGRQTWLVGAEVDSTEDECQCWTRETGGAGPSSQEISARVPRIWRLSKPAGVSGTERWEAASQPHLADHSPECKISH